MGGGWSAREEEDVVGGCGGWVFKSPGKRKHFFFPPLPKGREGRRGGRKRRRGREDDPIAFEYLLVPRTYHC